MYQSCNGSLGETDHDFYLGQPSCSSLFQKVDGCAQLLWTLVPSAGQEQLCTAVLSLSVATRCCLPIIVQSLKEKSQEILQ